MHARRFAFGMSGLGRVLRLPILPEIVLDQVEAFFISYNKQRGKKFKVISLGGPKKALKLLKQGMSAFDDKGTRNPSKPKSSH